MTSCSRIISGCHRVTLFSWCAIRKNVALDVLPGIQGVFIAISRAACIPGKTPSFPAHLTQLEWYVRDRYARLKTEYLTTCQNTFV